MRRYCWIATRAKLEILGLVPSNPRRNTSKQFLEVLRRGNKVATSCLFVASFSDHPLSSGNKEATCCHFACFYR
jgi:hypothetical protein